MKETMVALEAAGSGLVDWVSRARREQTAFVVLDGKTPVARLAPIEHRCTGAELAHALAAAELSPEEARAWAEDMQNARVALSAPEDKWR